MKLILFGLVLSAISSAAIAQDQMTPIQRRIERERQLLSSVEPEERRDALMKLAAMRHPEASRAAVSALNDSEPMIRVTAAQAILSLPQNEAANLLIPLTKDKLEFVRREAAHALGETRSRSAVGPLIELLSMDKEPSVRAAAAIALGHIGDESAAPALIDVLAGTSTKKESKGSDNEFLLRAAAQALGEIHSRAGVEVLIAALANETKPAEVRRAAAKSLGLIGDPAAKAALQAAFASDDPYLSQAAHEALRRLRAAGN